MEKGNIILISLDEVRHDHFSCYGYTSMSTPAIDRIAKEGVRFETCISTSSLTPVAMASILTAKFPNKHGMRHPYCYMTGPSIATILRENGYKTAGFVGSGLLSKNHGFKEGFDYYDEPTKDTMFKRSPYEKDGYEIYVGNYWVEDFFEWLNYNFKDMFFIWGHFFETHESGQYSLLEKGLIKREELSDFGYYDAKIKLVDEKLIDRLLTALDEFGIAENTTLVIMSDHGTNLGEHPAKPVHHRGGVTYPQHMTVYDCDLKVPLIIKGNGLPKGKVIKGMVRAIDVVPTLLELGGIPTDKNNFDGSSLLGVIEKGEANGLEVYSEELFEARGDGVLQSIRTDNFKFMRNLTLWTEEYYDLKEDPQEKNNIIENIDGEIIINLRKKMNAYLLSEVSEGKAFSKKLRGAVDKRLRGLGYIR